MTQLHQQQKITDNNYIIPAWPAPRHIKAFTTTRRGGYSKPPFDSFNFGHRSKDDIATVERNYAKMQQELHLPNDPVLLTQEHTNIVSIINSSAPPQLVKADANLTMLPNVVCTILTADCIPILICDQDATVVAAVHAGWKGIAGGIIETAIAATNTNPAKLLVWLGPAIGPNKFEVGNEVREIFTQQDTAAETAFRPYNDRWLADIYLLARQRLLNKNVAAIYGGEFCTYTQKELFFSYRRDQGLTGRMASLIWIAK